MSSPSIRGPLTGYDGESPPLGEGDSARDARGVLTDAENQIFWALVTTPLSCKGIARERGVSSKTVSSQCVEIYRKKGVSGEVDTDRRAALIQAYYATVLEDVRRVHPTQDVHPSNTHSVPSSSPAAAAATLPPENAASPGRTGPAGVLAAARGDIPVPTPTARAGAPSPSQAAPANFEERA